MTIWTEKKEMIHLLEGQMTIRSLEEKEMIF